jgi:uncharacterized protein (DUF2236 family)
MAGSHPNTSGWQPLRELVGMLFGPPLGPDAGLLSDSAPDPGLFGPQSQTWILAREPVLLLGGGRALLMQVANPLVAQGVLDHSDYARDPFGRLAGTVRWLVAVTFGTTAEAKAASAVVHRLHAKVRGTVSPTAATLEAPAGTPYSASDLRLARWVHATVVHSMLATYETLVLPLDPSERDGFVREWDAVARLMGVPTDLVWPDAAALDRYVVDEIAVLTATGRCTSASRIAAATVLRPPLPSPLVRPPFALTAWLTAGLLPAALCQAYGLRWTAAHEWAHRSVCSSHRRLHTHLPRHLRISPLYDVALRRCDGPGPQG